MEAEDRKYKESYIHSTYADQSRYSQESSTVGIDADFFQLPGRTLTPRRSVTSNASSNTTSGIASERLQTSIDESEGGWGFFERNPYSPLILDPENT